MNAIKEANGLFAFGGTLASRTPDGESVLFYGAQHPELFLTFDVSPVPEADAYAMFLAGLSLVAAAKRRSKK